MHRKKIESENQMPYFLFSILSPFFILSPRWTPVACVCSPCILQYARHMSTQKYRERVHWACDWNYQLPNGIKPNGVFMRNEKSNASKNLIKIRAGNVFFILAFGTMWLVLCSLFTRSKKFKKLWRKNFITCLYKRRFYSLLWWGIEIITATTKYQANQGIALCVELGYF